MVRAPQWTLLANSWLIKKEAARGREVRGRKRGLNSLCGAWIFL